MEDKKDKQIAVVDEIIDSLYAIKNKLISNQEVGNDDWVKVATPLHNNMALFMYNNNNECQSK